MFDGFKGSPYLNKPGTEVEWTEELIKEFARCKEDPIHFAKNHMMIVTRGKGRIKLPLYDYQEEIIRAIYDNTEVVVECARQAGKTTALTAFILHYIIFNRDKTVAILANKGETAREILARVKFAYELLPLWLKHGVGKWNEGSMVLENGSRVFAAATSNDNIRGYSIDVCFVDEAAFIENWDSFFTALYGTISSDTSGKATKMILVSTVNGLNHFYEITNQARKGTNNYKLISVKWDQVPGRDQAWKERTLKGMNNNAEKFSQEYENEYLGSSGTLVAGWKLKELAITYEVPSFNALDIKQYRTPQVGHSYVLTVDVSRGKALDYSAIQVIDISKMPYQQVLVYRSNVTTPSDFSEIINRIGKAYNNGYVFVEINDIGQQVAEILHDDYEYENMIKTENKGRLGKKIFTAFGGDASSDRGIRTTKTVKNIGCSMLKLLIEQNQLEIRDLDTINELSTFSKKGKSYEAEKGKHDDLVMCLVIFAWLSDQPFFKELTDIATMKEIRDFHNSQLDAFEGPLTYATDGNRENYKPEKRGEDYWVPVDNVYPYK